MRRKLVDAAICNAPNWSGEAGCTEGQLKLGAKFRWHAPTAAAVTVPSELQARHRYGGFQVVLLVERRHRLYSGLDYSD
jgi:hypothetical protein